MYVCRRSTAKLVLLMTGNQFISMASHYKLASAEKTLNSFLSMIINNKRMESCEIKLKKKHIFACIQKVCQAKRETEV
jgi:hypothetical protein